MDKKQKPTQIFITLFIILITLQILDIITLQILDIVTTSIAYEVGLGADEINPLAAVLMSYNLLWLGKAVAIVIVGIICYSLWKKDEKKLAINGIFVSDCIYVCVVGINLLSIGMVT
ncbi:hypothetical protein KAW18_02370 [candidate division WOR-3 bacterium]|nr:hypothetical protein [candidate division WOR-3 bacterium]